MKVISIDRSKSREEKLLDREIQILSDMKKFKHENIVQYVEFFHLDGYTYIIMEYCEGGTLFEYIHTQTWNSSRAHFCRFCTANSIRFGGKVLKMINPTLALATSNTV